MDKERLRKQAEGFNGYGDCFIHTEMKNGVNCETCLCGDPYAIIHGIAGEITRISELTGITFEQVLGELRRINKSYGRCRKV